MLSPDPPPAPVPAKSILRGLPFFGFLVIALPGAAWSVERDADIEGDAIGMGGGANGGGAAVAGLLITFGFIMSCMVLPTHIEKLPLENLGLLLSFHLGA